MGVDIKKITEKIVNIILDIAIFIFGIILLISIYNNVQTKILKNSYSSFFGYTVFGVQTGSMADEINAGDWIIVKGNKNYKIDDVVTYMQDGEFITHRIVESYKNTFITKGDANNTKDDPINKDQIVGKVIKILPNFEIFRKTLFNPIVLLCVIITLYLAVALFKKNNDETSKININEIINNIKNKFKNIEKFDNLKNKTREIVGKTKDTFAETKKNINKVKENIKTEKLQKEKKKEEKNEENKVVIKEVEKTDDITNEEQEVVIDPSSDEEDLDKTMCFRMITVDKTEIENAYNKPIVEEEKDEEPSEIKKILNEVEKEEVIKENLELLSKKGKKCRTIIEKCMYIKEQEIEKIVEILLDGEKSKINYATIKDAFIKSYIDGRYYNFCGNVNVEFNNRNKVKRLNLVIEDTKNDLIKKYKGSDNKYSDKVIKFVGLFELVNYFENSSDNKLSLKEKRIAYSNKIKKNLDYDDFDDRKLKSISEEIIKTQRLYLGMIKYTLEKIDTNLFKLNYSNLSRKDIYAVDLEHNISFSKIYSDYIVDKTYSEGLIAEDKMQVLLTLLSSEIINNMLSCEFNKKYIIYVPETVYTKGNKLDDIFDMFEDEYAKNNIIVLVKYSKMGGNKEIIKKLIKKGYHFAIDINDTAKFKVSDQEMFEMVDYLFLSDKNPNKESTMLFINKTLHKKIIFDDISNKIESYTR